MRISSGMPADFVVEAGYSTKNNGTAVREADSQETTRVDTTALSTGQDRVAGLVSQLNSLPDVRQDKVDSLRTAIQQGQYKVSPEQIAAAMYRDMASFTGADTTEFGLNAGY